MSNYIDIERKLNNINHIEGCSPYQCDNFVAPWVVGFVRINKDVKVEVAYGSGMSAGDWIIGLTPFFKGKLMPLDERSKYSKCFCESEIPKIDEYIDFLKKELNRPQKGG